ncbi:PREDICTED: CASP-like protein 4D1 [Populus euphratica]|uniref:CASP-like protein n=1 Tax=Populus euphratica TaxID=75702 RepID=A0AAJ6UEZ6_POPEU|nr:PREDICTED: CASP-like protein 4D1 [Populus euphratica]
MCQPAAQASKAFPITALSVRVLTLIFLLASLIVLATDTATFRNLASREVTLRFKNIYAYRYMLSANVIGLAYTLLQIPFAIHHVSLGKRVINHVSLLYFDFFGDKVILSLLATGVGAGFGATSDLKENLDQLDRFTARIGYPVLSEIRPKGDNFFNTGFVSASLLLMGFLCSAVSSIISSLALSIKE